MVPRLLRNAALTALAALLASTCLLWVHGATARPLGDFTPTMSASEAKAVVAAAQRADAARRAATQQIQGVDPAGLPLVQTVYFAQSGHHLSNRSGFLDFWRQNGQVVVFGLPISEEIVEEGRIVQYFERARFEYLPSAPGSAGQVQLGLIGREYMALRGIQHEQVPDPQSGVAYFPETGHTLWGEFAKYWNKRGKLPIFGYPLTENHEENGRIVQYFERVRFEYFPEDMDDFYRSNESALGLNLDTLYEVRLADLGRQLAEARGVNLAPVPQLAGTAQWHPSIYSRHIDIDLSSQWLTAYEDELQVYNAPIATGRDGFNTPVGNYAIYDRYRIQTMAGSAAGETWHVPDIPWVQYVVGGVALHGTYWHDAWGTGVRMSHGCINLNIDDAQWLYEWAAVGTSVSIHY